MVWFGNNPKTKKAHKKEEMGLVGDKVSIFDRVLSDSWNLVCTVLSPLHHHLEAWKATLQPPGNQPDKDKDKDKDKDIVIILFHHHQQRRGHWPVKEGQKIRRFLHRISRPLNSQPIMSQPKINT